jgi:thiol-disulfide isomerase/thioredoxin
VKIILSLLVSAAVCTAEAAENAVPAGKVVPSPQGGSARPKPEEATLIEGSAVTTDVFAKLDWIQGSGPKTWEPGKVYLFECWATWCGPCIAAIPHVNELHQKYSGKGLIISGINVWEDGKDKVVEFVKKKGDGMAYNVAYTGKGGAFETEWLTPAGVTGIPHAFVVKDGKILLKTHPMQLTDGIIEAFLAGGDAQKKAIDGIAAKQAAQGKVSGVMRAYSQAKAKNDAEGIAKAISDLKELDADSPYLSMMGFDLLIAKKDWAAAETGIGTLPEQGRLMTLFGAARSLLSSKDEVPATFVKAVATTLAPEMESKGGPMENQMIAALLWKAGEKEAALKAAKLAAEKAASAPATPGRMSLPVAPFTSYAEALEKGTPPTAEEFAATVRAEMQKSAPAAPKSAE